MASYVLSYWESVELFCDLIALKEKLPSEEILVNSIETYISTYIKPKEHKAFAKKIFGTRQDDKGKTVINHAGILYDLITAIRTREPLIISRVTLEDSLRKIGKSQTIKQYREIITNQVVHKEFSFAGTFWWIYYHTMTKKESGVSRGLLYLLPFGKAIIKRIPISDNAELGIETYVGHYAQYEKDTDCLELSLVTEKKKARDLRILLHTGEDVPDVATGSYTNNNAYEMLSGAVLIEAIEAIKNKELHDKIKESREKGDHLIKDLLQFSSFMAAPLFRPLIMDFFQKKPINILPKKDNSFDQISDSLENNGRRSGE